MQNLSQKSEIRAIRFSNYHGKAKRQLIAGTYNSRFTNLSLYIVTSSTDI